MHRKVYGKTTKGSASDTVQINLSKKLALLGTIDKSSGKLQMLMVTMEVQAESGPTKSMLRTAKIALNKVAPSIHGIDEAISSMKIEHLIFGNLPSRQIGKFKLNYEAVVPHIVTIYIEPGTLPSPDKDDHSIMAYAMCKEAVKQRLRSPSSADFPWSADRIIKNPNDPDSFVVRGHVDAQNGFGAMIRADWLCQTAYDGSGEDVDPANWSVFDVAMQER